MAKNLRSKIAESDTMFIHDVNPATTEKFAEEVGNVKVGKDVRDVAENAVCQIVLQRSELCPVLSLEMNPYCSIYDLSWQRKLFY